MTKQTKRGPGGRVRKGTGLAFALLSVVAAMAACTADGAGVTGGINTGKSPSPGASAQGTGSKDQVPGTIGGGSASPSTLPSGNTSNTNPSPTPTAGPGVKSVVISPSEATLNVPAADSVTTASYATSQVFSATVFLEPTGQNSQVKWSISSGAKVATASAGDGGLGYSVEVLADAATGSVVLTATSIKDPTKKATASIFITRNSQVELDIK